MDNSAPHAIRHGGALSLDSTIMLMPFSRRLVSATILLAAILSAGCSTIDTSDNPVLYDLFQESTPKSIAVAPFYNLSGVEGGGEMMRQALYGELSPLGYEDVELSRIDRRISAVAVENNMRPEDVMRTMPEALLDPSLADAVIYGSVSKISRLFLLVYARHRVDVELIVRDARTGQPLYTNEYVIQNRLIQAPTGIFSLIGSFFQGLWHMRASELQETLDAAAEQISERFPRPFQLAGAGTTFIHRAEVGFPPRDTLLVGDNIVVRVEGTPERKGAFSIGNILKSAPLNEVSPGQYSGTYTVKPGDEVRYTFVTVQLSDPSDPSGPVRYAIHEEPFSVDATPPPPYRVVKWGQDPARPGVFLEIGPAVPRTPEPTEPPASFFIFRGPLNAEDLEYIGTSSTPTFYDPTARPGVTYLYGIIAIDEAGNSSEHPAEFDKITPRPRSN